MSLNLVYSIVDSGPTMFFQMIIQFYLDFLQQGQICSLMLLYGKIYTLFNSD